jgi:hypothetical protein
MNYGIKCDFAVFKLRIQVTDKESVLVKRSIKSLMSLENLRNKRTGRYFLQKIFQVVSGIFTTLRMSFLNKEASEVFDFFVMNKSKIKEVEAKSISENKVSFTFIKK